MKVRLLPLAVAAAIAAPGVALAEGPTVYGKLNVSYEMVDVDYAYDFQVSNAGVPSAKDPSSADNYQLISNSSRLGVKGDAAINDRLKAIYQAEFGIEVDDGAGGSSDQTFTQRDIFAGLSGGFGTVQVGMFDTPLKKAQGKVDLFNDLSGDLQYAFVGENRAKNIVQYSTPAIAGFQANIAAMPGEQFDDGNDNTDDKDGPADAFSASVTFATDMLYVALAHDSEVVSKAYIGVSPSFALTTNNFLGATNVINTETYWDTTRLVGVLMLNAFQLGAMYQTAETSDTDIIDLDQDGFLLSASFKISDIVLKGQYAASTLGDNEDDEDDDTEQLALGVDYLMSKQTTLFAYVNMLSYEYDFDGSEEQTKDNFGVGLVHSF